MDVTEAIDRWMRGEMSIKEVYMVTGVRSLKALHAEVQYDAWDRENEREHWGYEDDAREEQEFLETIAWNIWSDWLREEPEYLEGCVRMLRYEKTRNLGIGRPQTAAVH
ncbi:hypothetical protein HJB78_16565 [Rhizobium lentis]|uniref:hypothetical protein n=1 Tax=Rhizobium lentis TaxID=1138194 RepID=UPI001C83F251|nr:hypothetical protein [Rhizobium lentis]MBX5152585.1 hypothetical protein [Rhizobium lentis]